MFAEENKIKEFIIDSGLVSKKDMSAALVEAGAKKMKLAEVLANSGKISADDLRKIQALANGVPFVDLRNKKIDLDVLSLVPEPISRAHNVVAFNKSGDSVEVAVLDMDDFHVIDSMWKRIGLKLLPRLTSVESIKSILLQYQRALKAEFGDIIKSEMAVIRALDRKASDRDGLIELANDLSVVRMFDALLKNAIMQGASDIHIESLDQGVLIRYRIHGVLHEAMTLTKDAELPVAARAKLLAGLKLTEGRAPQQGKFKVEMNGEKVSFGVSTVPTVNGEKIVMHLLRESASKFSLDGLGFRGEALERIHSAIKHPKGLILITGPKDSGKTTTAYSIIDVLNTPNVDIATIEENIEQQINRINQTQINPEIGFGFAEGLRSIVKQDPDIIMVGNADGRETALLSVNTALAGRLVIACMTAGSGAGALRQLIDMKIEPLLLASTVSVVVGQRAVRKLDSNKELKSLSKSELGALAKIVDMEHMLELLKHEHVIGKKDGWGDVKFASPKTSGRNDRNGYDGQIVIHEVMKITPTIKELLIKGAKPSEIENQAKKEGMITMLEDGILAAARGITTIEEVLGALAK